MDNNWSRAENWAGDVAPSPGDNLVFPAGAARLSNVNDFAADTAFASILITGNNYSLTGNEVLLGGSVSSQGTGNSLGLNLKLSANGGIANTAASSFTVGSAISLNGHNLSVSNTSGSGTTLLNGAISGAGNLTSSGSGQTVLAVANSYSGITTLTSGTLALRNSLALGAADGTAATGTVLNGGTLQLEDAITVTGERLSGSSLNVRSIGTTTWAGTMTTPDGVTLQAGSGQSLQVTGTVTSTSFQAYGGGTIGLGGTGSSVGSIYISSYYTTLQISGTVAASFVSSYDYYQTLQVSGTLTVSAQLSLSGGSVLQVSGAVTPPT